MKSFTSRRFRDMYANLPKDIQLRADRAYQLFRRNPAHPGLHFKKIDHENLVYSARVGLGYRALGRMDGLTRKILWPHVGSRLLPRRRASARRARETWIAGGNR